MLISARRVRRLAALVTAVGAVAITSNVLAQTWNGGGGDDNWGTGANWTGGSPVPGTTTDIFFDGSTRLTPFNNYTPWDDFRNITFNAGAGPFTLNGNAIDLWGKIENLSANTQVINFADIGTGTLSGSFIEMNPINGDLNINSANLFLGNNQLRVFGNNGFALTFGASSIISGAGATVAINQNSVVRYQSAHTYTGSTFVNAGRLEMMSGSSIANSNIQLGDTTGTANAEFRLTQNGGYDFNRPITVRSGSSGIKTISSTNTTGTNTLSGGITLNDATTFAVSPGGNLTVAGGTTFSGGSNALSVTGGGTLQFGNMGNSAVTASWGATNISGGSTLSYTRGTNIGSSGAVVTINDGTLRLGTDNSGTFTYDNPISVGVAGATLVAQYSGNVSVFQLNGNLTGTSNLVLQAAGNASNWRGAPGLRFGGDNSGFTGAVTIRSSAVQPNQFGSGMVTFTSSDSVLNEASSISVRDGGIIGFSYAVSASELANVTAGPRGGIGATGAAGTLTALSNPMTYVGPGGVLLLDNRNSLNNDRLANDATLALSSNRLNIIGRDADSNVTNEVAGAMSFTGGTILSMDRLKANNSGVKLTVDSLATPSAGNSLLIQADHWGTTGTLNNLIVTGTKPAVTNGMLSPGIQQFNGGNNMGNFMTFSGDNLVAANPTSSDITTAGATDIVNIGTAQSLTTTKNIHALRIGENLTLTGATLTVDSGGVIMTSKNISGTGTLDFASNPGFIGAYNASSQASISAKISGSAGLTILGTSQTLSITGSSNDFTGGIFINGGVARFSTAGANGNDVTVNAFGRLVAGTSAGGTDQIGGLAGTGVVSAWVANSGSFPNTLQMSPATGTYTFEGALLNGSGSPRPLNITKLGAGTQVFGTDSVGTYTGTTTIDAGTLRMNGTYSGGGTWTVNAGRLEGTGTIAAPVSVAGGTIAPGTSIGTLTVGSLTLASTAVYEVEVGASSSDRIVTTGDTGTVVTLGGATLTLVAAGVSGSGGTYLIIDQNPTADAVSGTFANSAGVFAGIWNYVVHYNVDSSLVAASGNDVYLSVSPVPEPASLGLLAMASVGLLRRRRA